MPQITDVIKHLIIINVIVFLAASALPQYVPNLSLFFPASEHFQPYQLVTHMFMHGGIPHLAFNMLSLFFLGPYVENELGPKRFLIFYLLCGFGAMLAHIVIDYFSYNQLSAVVDPSTFQEILDGGRNVIQSGQNYTDTSLAKLNEVLNIPVVGASGAIYGVTIAFATLFPNVKLQLLFIPFPVKAKFMVAGLLAYDLFMGANHIKTGVAHFAHLGGAITGFLLIYFFFSNRFEQRR